MNASILSVFFFIMVLFCIFLMFMDVKCPFKCLFAIWACLDKCLFRYFAYFEWDFCLTWLWEFFLFWMQALIIHVFCKYFINCFSKDSSFWLWWSPVYQIFSYSFFFVSCLGNLWPQIAQIFYSVFFLKFYSLSSYIYVPFQVNFWM